MEELAVPGLIGACAIVVVGPAEVDDVTEQMSHRILRYRPAEPGTDPPVRDGTLAHRVALDRQPPDQHEAASAQQLLPNRFEHRGERGQMEVFPADTRDGTIAGVDRLDRRGDLRDLGFAQNMHPVVALAHIVGAPRVGARDRPVRH